MIEHEFSHNWRNVKQLLLCMNYDEQYLLIDPVTTGRSVERHSEQIVLAECAPGVPSS